ncbi:MAG: tRNA pseudouridine(55) synthase TruB [Propionibacteriaceae bacterium]|nr:tRNA pseudouridine(55) synthase TruB [Propionibacteriaceae bacterium]
MTTEQVVTSGLLVIDKPSGCTSQQAVSRVKHRLADEAGIAAKKLKVGHAGTLDPMATGVLVVGIGRATRLLGFIAGHGKQYLATIRLGHATTTDDAEGELVGQLADATRLTDEQIASAVGALTGDIEQVPSAVSAIKVDGKRAYALVRAGSPVELAPRAVTIDRFEVLARRVALFVDLDVIVDCSSGTYVRALARDLGAALRVGGHLTALRRTRVGAFNIEHAVPLDDATWANVIPLDDVAPRLFESMTVGGEVADDVSHGRALSIPVPADPTAVIGPTGQFLALYQREGDRSVPVAVFVDGAGE